MPRSRAVPAMTSSTARTGAPEGISLSDIGSALSAIRTMRPSLRMKNQVERDVGVVHPERDRLIGKEVEKHALPLRQLLAVHQTALALRFGRGKLDVEGMHPRGTDNLKGALSGCLRKRERSEHGACADKHCRNEADGGPTVPIQDQQEQGSMGGQA